MADAAANQPTLKGSLPLYKKPEPLSAQAHQGKGLRYLDRPFDFLAGTHFVPVTLGEFGMASGRYPIIFLGDTRTPVVAMGLQAGANLFVDPANGQFEPYAYLPAFVRRYPFVAASFTDQEDRFTICVDTESHLFSDDPEEPFFNADGTPTPFLDRAIDYVRRFETDVAETRKFVDRMIELDLLDQQEATFQPRDAQGNPAGDPQVVASYWGVSGEKFRSLDPAKLAELRDNTYLGAIYSHMLSLAQWELLIQRAAVRQRGGAATGSEAPPPPPPDA